MLDIGGPELLVVAVIALIVVGPKDLPRVVRGVAKVVGQVRGMANEFKSSIQELEDESEFRQMKQELDDMARKEMDEARSYVTQHVPDLDELENMEAIEAAEDEAPISYDDLPDVKLEDLQRLEAEQQAQTLQRNTPDLAPDTAPYTPSDVSETMEVPASQDKSAAQQSEPPSKSVSAGQKA
ncbi:MAG: hypothetical protein Alpg2KO_10300 [Alphaproteobacteria bacterium]